MSGAIRKVVMEIILSCRTEEYLAGRLYSELQCLDTLYRLVFDESLVHTIEPEELRVSALR